MSEEFVEQVNVVQPMNDSEQMNVAEQMSEPTQTTEVVIDFKKEKKFCSGIGMNFFIFFLIANGLQLLVSGLVMALAPQMAVDNYGLYLVLAMAPMYVIGVPVLVKLCKRREAVQLTQHKLGFGNFVIFMTMCFALMIIGNFIGMFINFIIGLIKGAPVINSVDVLMNSSSLWANIIIVGICAPIFEELMFRKLIVDRMVRYGEATAIVVSGLMFGLFHGNFTQFFYAAALGMIFAFIYVKTGRLRYTIIAHMIINMSSTLMVPVLSKIDMAALDEITNLSMSMTGNVSEAAVAEMMTTLSGMIVPLVILMLFVMFEYGMALVGIIFLILRRKSFTCNAGTITLPKGKRASVVWFNVGMILFTISCLALFVYMILVG